MTRLIITGRNNSMPRDAAQSMAHLMPREPLGQVIAFRPIPSLEARIAAHMRITGAGSQAAAIRELLQIAFSTTDSASQADSAAGASGHLPEVSSPGAHPTIAGAARGARS